MMKTLLIFVVAALIIASSSSSSPSHAEDAQIHGSAAANGTAQAIGIEATRGNTSADYPQPSVSVNVAEDSGASDVVAGSSVGEEGAENKREAQEQAQAQGQASAGQDESKKDEKEKKDTETKEERTEAAMEPAAGSGERAAAAAAATAADDVASPSPSSPPSPAGAEAAASDEGYESLEEFSKQQPNVAAAAAPPAPPAPDIAALDLLTFEDFTRMMQQEEGGIKVIPRVAYDDAHLHNYASVDCGAQIMASNPEAKEPLSVLTRSKDDYMLTPCDAQTYIVIELCNHVLVREIRLANFELFSSMFTDVRVSISESYPGAWLYLDTVHAKGVRDVQSFKIKEPRTFAKYVKLEFLSHTGDEYYCPVSLVQVRGMTMMDEFNLYKQHIERELAGTHPAALPHGTIDAEHAEQEQQCPGGACRQARRGLWGLVEGAFDAVANIFRGSAIHVPSPSDNETRREDTLGTRGSQAEDKVVEAGAGTAKDSTQAEESAKAAQGPEAVKGADEAEDKPGSTEGQGEDSSNKTAGVPDAAPEASAPAAAEAAPAPTSAAASGSEDKAAPARESTRDASGAAAGALAETLKTEASNVPAPVANCTATDNITVTPPSAAAVPAPQPRSDWRALCLEAEGDDAQWAAMSCDHAGTPPDKCLAYSDSSRRISPKGVLFPSRAPSTATATVLSGVKGVIKKALGGVLDVISAAVAIPALDADTGVAHACEDCGGAGSSVLTARADTVVACDKTLKAPATAGEGTSEGGGVGTTHPSSTVTRRMTVAPTALATPLPLPIMEPGVTGSKSAGAADASMNDTPAIPAPQPEAQESRDKEQVQPQPAVPAPVVDSSTNSTNSTSTNSTGVAEAPQNSTAAAPHAATNTTEARDKPKEKADKADAKDTRPPKPSSSTPPPASPSAAPAEGDSEGSKGEGDGAGGAQGFLHLGSLSGVLSSPTESIFSQMRNMITILQRNATLSSQYLNLLHNRTIKLNSTLVDGLEALARNISSLTRRAEDAEARIVRMQSDKQRTDELLAAMSIHLQDLLSFIRAREGEHMGNVDWNIMLARVEIAFALILALSVWWLWLRDPYGRQPQLCAHCRTMIKRGETIKAIASTAAIPLTPVASGKHSVRPSRTATPVLPTPSRISSPVVLRACDGDENSEPRDMLTSSPGPLSMCSRGADVVRPSPQRVTVAVTATAPSTPSDSPKRKGRGEGRLTSNRLDRINTD